MIFFAIRFFVAETARRKGDQEKFTEDNFNNNGNDTKTRDSPEWVTSGKERDAGCTVSPGDDVNPLNRSGIAAERPRSPSVSAPHRESLARPTGPGLLTYLIVPKVPKVPWWQQKQDGAGYEQRRHCCGRRRYGPGALGDSVRKI